MKKHIILSLFLGLVAFTFTATPTASANPGYFMSRDVVISAGTLVLLELNEEIQSNRLTVGQLVKFKVTTDVVAKGRIVIRTGAIAMGRVKLIKKTTYNNAEELTIEVTTVQAVDGQQIPLSGNEQIIKGDFPNQGATGRIGKTISATVMNNTEVDAN